MDFDIALYETFTNAQLLKILLHPDQYRTEAVQAATDILARRNVTDDDRRAAGYIIHEPANEEHINKILFEDHPEAGVDLLESFDMDSTEKPSRSFQVFFGLTCLYYLRLAYTSGRAIYFSLKYDHNFSFFIILIDLFYVFVIPFALYRLYMRKRNGWYIIFAEITITAIPSLYYFFMSRMFYWSCYQLSFAFVIYLMSMIMKPLIFFFLWEKGTAAYAGINMEQKKKALLICGGILAAMIGIAYFLSTHQTF